MAEIEDKTRLVAYCGLYCGGCGSYKKGRCKACKMDGGFSRCQVRKCCTELNYQSCAECDKYLNCKTLDNFIAKIFAFIFRSDRKGNLGQIKEMGIEQWAREQVASGEK